MARPVRPWFRYYTETFSDRKILRLKPEQRWLWTAILGAARESHLPGTLLVAEGVPMTSTELARYADVNVRMVGPALDAMESLGMITRDGGVITVTNFLVRQYESDDVTARTRAYRERSKERDGNVPKPSKERSRNVRGNVPETETETETETEVEKTPSPPVRTCPDFEQFWHEYPRKVGKGQARKAYEQARRKATPEALLASVAVLSRAYAGQDRQFIPHPATWLNAERWSDQPEDIRPTPAPTLGRKQQETDDLFGRMIARARGNQDDDHERKAIGQ